MGKETDADTLCKSNDDLQHPKLPYKYTMIFLGWCLGFIAVFWRHLSPFALLLLAYPPLFILLLLSVVMQIFLVDILHSSTNDKQKRMIILPLAGLFMAIIYVVLYLLSWRELPGRIDFLQILVWPGKFISPDVIAIFVLGVFLGIIPFILLEYPKALTCYGLIIVIPSFQSLMFLQNIVTSGFGDSLRSGMNISILVAPLGFSIGLILVGIRAIISSRKLSIEDSQR